MTPIKHIDRRHFLRGLSAGGATLGYSVYVRAGDLAPSEGSPPTVDEIRASLDIRLFRQTIPPLKFRFVYNRLFQRK